MRGKRVIIGMFVLVSLTVAGGQRAFAAPPGGRHGGPPAHQPPPPGPQAMSPEYQKLFDDIGLLLPAVQNTQPFLAKARASQEAARRHQGCAAVNILGALRNQIMAKRGKKGFSPEAAASLDADALNVMAFLLGGPDTAPCGGGIAPAPGAAPETTVVGSDVNGLQVHVSLPRAHLAARMGGGLLFTYLSMDGMGIHNDLGKPDVPALTRLFAVPAGADVSVQLLGSTSYVLRGVTLFPEQEQPADQSDPFADKPFVIDSKFYAGQVPFPMDVTRAGRLGTMRDLQIGGLEVDGGQFNPASRMVRIFTSMDVKVTFGGKNTGFFGGDDLASVWNLPYQSLYSNTLLNYATAKANLAAVSRFFCGEELLVVTSSALRPAADTFAAARRADGFSTRVVEVGSGAGQIGTTNTQIRDFIRSELSAACFIRPSYVAIIGDTANVPTFLEPTAYGVGFDGMIASDLEYGLADGADLFADLAVGRIPAGDPNTAERVVAKIIGYEDSPPFSFSFYGRATFTSYFQGADSTDDRGFTKTSETIRDALLASGYSVDRIYTDDGAGVDPRFYYDGTAIPAALRKPGFAWDGTGADVLSQWNAGRFIVFHRDHGFPGGWGHPDFDTTDIPSLTNGAFLPVVFSINCASGKFDDPTPNYSEQLLQRDGGGAVGVIGDSRNSPSWTNNHMVLGLFDAVFPNVLPAYGSGTPIRRMGDVLNAGKLYMDTQNGLDGQDATTTQAEHYLYHWFGDPTMQIYTARPFVFTITAVKAFLLPGDIVQVQLPQSDAEDAVVTLVQDGDVIGRAQIRGGEAMIVPGTPINPSAEELMISFDKTAFQPASILIGLQPTSP